MKYSANQVYLILLLLLNGCISKKRPEAAQPLVQQATVEMAAKNYARALQLLDEALVHERTLQVEALRANLLYNTGQYAAAACEFQRLAAYKETRPSMRADLLNNAASALYRIGKKEEALTIWHALTQDPAYIAPEVAWYNIGIAYLCDAERSLYDRAHYEKALSAFERSLAVSHDYIDPLFYTAYTFLQMKEVEAAKKVVEYLLSLVPEHEQGKNLLAHINVLCEKAVVAA